MKDQKRNNLMKTIATQFNRIDSDLLKLKSLILDLRKMIPESNEDQGHNLQELPPMKMVEEILDASQDEYKSHKVSGQTLVFIQGIKKFHEEQGYLTALQVDSIVNTYQGFSGES